MERIQVKMNQILSTLVKAMVDKDVKEWPPGCAYFMYQPIRPERHQFSHPQNKSTEDNESK